MKELLRSKHNYALVINFGEDLNTFISVSLSTGLDARRPADRFSTEKCRFYHDPEQRHVQQKSIALNGHAIGRKQIQRSDYTLSDRSSIAAMAAVQAEKGLDTKDSAGRHCV